MAEEGRTDPSGKPKDDDVSVLAIIENPTRPEDSRKVQRLPISSEMTLERSQEHVEGASGTTHGAFKNVDESVEVKGTADCSGLGKPTPKATTKDDSDYVRDSMETTTTTTSSSSSSSSSSSIGGGGGEGGGGVEGGGGGALSSTSVCSLQQTKRELRNKRKKRTYADIRRNPIRASKNNRQTGRNFKHTRHSLLSAKDRGQAEAGKQEKLPTRPYMNTRSVTRKLFKIGATYEAPTIKDEKEFRDWPVHGMHERPIFHPRVGLAAEYNGRVFVSVDDQFYREIVNYSDVEVVSVDPYGKIEPEKKDRRRKKVIAKKSSKAEAKKNVGKAENFGTCMHNSLHSVLSYCSQIMDPVCKNVAVEGTKNFIHEERSQKLATTDLSREKSLAVKYSLDSSSKSLKRPPPPPPPTTFGDKSVDGKETKKYIVGPATTLEKTYSVGIKLENNALFNKVNVNSLSNFGKQCSIDVKFQLSQKQLSAEKLRNPILHKQVKSSENTFENLKIVKHKNFENRFIIQDSGKKAPVKILEAKNIVVSNDANLAESSAVCGNFMKIEDSSITDEALMEMSSIYKHLISSEDLEKENKIHQTMKRISHAHRVNGNLNKFRLSSENDKNKVLLENNAIASKLSVNDSKFLFKPKTFSHGEIQCYTPVNRVKLQNDFTVPIKQYKNENKLERIKVSGGGSMSMSEIQENYQIQASTSGQHQPYYCKSDEKPSTSRKMDNEKKCKSEEKTLVLQELLENTVVLYCAANGVHQDDVANYLNSLDAKQVSEWIPRH